VQVLLDAGDAKLNTWLGAGDFFGEIEFFMDTDPLCKIVAAPASEQQQQDNPSRGTTLWCLDRSVVMNREYSGKGPCSSVLTVLTSCLIPV
jgi:hypothetical protein